MMTREERAAWRDANNVRLRTLDLRARKGEAVHGPKAVFAFSSPNGNSSPTFDLNAGEVALCVDAGDEHAQAAFIVGAALDVAAWKSEPRIRAWYGL